MKNSRKSFSSFTYQVLQPRNLLAGDVTVTVDDFALTVLGDFEDNQILIVGSPDGSVTVSGLEDTTINGGTGPFVSGPNLETAEILTFEGNDEVEIRGLVLEDDLILLADEGDDSIDIQDINADDIEVVGGDGNDVLEFDNVFSRDSIEIIGGDGDDTVAIGAVASGDDASIDTGSGDDLFAADNLGIGENLDLEFGDGDDQALIAGETYGRRADIDLGDGNDSLSILPTTNDAEARFPRRLTIDGDDGDDTVVLDASVSADRRSRIDGDSGDDAFEEGGADLERSRIRSFESEEVVGLDAQLDTFFAALAANSIDVTRFGGTDGPVDTAPASLTLNPAPLVQTRDGDPQSIDDTLTLTGDDDLIVSGVFIDLVGFQIGEDSFFFSGTDTISGIFEDGSLELTGDASLAEYQEALRSVNFGIISEVPSTADRTLNLTVTFADDSLAPLTASRTVNIVAEDLLTVSDTPLIFTEGDFTTLIDESLLLAGNSETEITSATIALSDFVDGDDQFVFPENDLVTSVFDINEDDNVATLTLTGDASVEDFGAALGSVTFQNTADVFVPSTRTVEYTVITNTGELTGSRTINLVAAEPTTEALTLEAVEDQSLGFGQSLNLTLDATSSAGDESELDFEIVDAGALTGQLSVTQAGELTLPVAAEAGTFDVVVAVTDALGERAEQAFSIDVAQFVPFEGVGALSNVPAELRNDIFTSAPPQDIDTSLTFDAVFDTSEGEIRVRLLDDESPTFVNNFINLAEDGFYDGLTFHRVLEGFVAQGGDPLGTGTGGPGFVIPDEVGNDIEFDARGQLSFANAGSGTTGSQFFFTFAPTNLSNAQFSVFGNIISGDEVLDDLVRTATSTFTGEIPIPGAVASVINSVTIEEVEV